MKFKKCLIVLYFGKMNNYFDLWLNSCKYNRTYDFILYTDDCSSHDYPKNVKVHYCSFEDIKDKIQTLYDFEIALKHPYKLCDYRPAFGEIFADITSEYDYWGYCDLDVIFGDIDSFYPDEMLQKYDKVSEFGHFTLYRNAPILRSIYRENVDGMLNYKDVFSSEKSFHFDEGGFGRGINEILAKKGFNVQIRPFYFADIIVNSYALRTIREKWDLEPQRQLELQKKKIFYKYYKGKLTQYSLIDNKIYEQEEMYIHFQKRPMKNKAKTVDSFIIIPPNIIKKTNANNTISKKTFRCIKEKPSTIFAPARKVKTLIKIIIKFLLTKYKSKQL